MTEDNEIKKIKKDMKILMEVINTNQETIGYILARLEMVEKNFDDKEEEKNKKDFMFS